MNIYFIDPKYIKDVAWMPLLSYLKVKDSLSFIPDNELPNSLKDIIYPSRFENQGPRGIDNCSFWLREHLENCVRLKIKDYPDGNVPKDSLKNYSTNSPQHNIENLGVQNVLILTPLCSTYDSEGIVQAPLMNKYIDVFPGLMRYCLNILHKKYGHNEYDKQCSAILFDEFMSRSFLYFPKRREWLPIKFAPNVLKGVHDIDPSNFQLTVSDNGKEEYTSLITDFGQQKLSEFLNEVKEAIQEYRESITYEDSWHDWQREVDQMNRDFWNECGESSVNCDF